jgi:hypothetical protein
MEDTTYDFRVASVKIRLLQYFAVRCQAYGDLAEGMAKTKLQVILVDQS